MTKFCEGAVFLTRAAVHTLAGPGSFSVTVHVIDQFGAPASVTESFSVSGAASAATSAAQSEEAIRKPARPQPEPIRRPEPSIGLAKIDRRAGEKVTANA